MTPCVVFDHHDGVALDRATDAERQAVAEYRQSVVGRWSARREYTRPPGTAFRQFARQLHALARRRKARRRRLTKTDIGRPTSISVFAAYVPAPEPHQKNSRAFQWSYPGTSWMVLPFVLNLQRFPVIAGLLLHWSHGT